MILTSRDPRCQAVLAKLADARERMRLYGIQTLLEGRAYVPALTKAAEQPAPEPKGNVLPMRKRRGP
jgi:hypothetical protein